MAITITINTDHNIGSPAAGKGTMCNKLLQDPEITCHEKLRHISIGDHLRMLRDRGLLDPAVAKALAKQELISGETLMAIIEDEVTDQYEKFGMEVFLLDGFPRNEEQMESFSQKVSRLQHFCRPRHFFSGCSFRSNIYQYIYTFAILVGIDSTVARERFLARKDASRAQDDLEMFEKRYPEYLTSTMPLIEPIRKASLLVEMDSQMIESMEIDDVYLALKTKMKEHLVAKKMFE